MVGEQETEWGSRTAGASRYFKNSSRAGTMAAARVVRLKGSVAICGSEAAADNKGDGANEREK